MPPSSDPLPADSSRAHDLPATTVQLARAVEGDANSLTWIVDHLSPALRAYAAYRIGRVLRQHYDPDDLVHDAWLAALPKLQELIAGNDRRRTPVLLKYLSNTIVFRIRDLARRHARGAPEPAMPPPSEIPAAVSGAVTRACRRERHDELHRQLDELEPQDREILLLRGIEQLSADATATLLGLGVEATHKRFQRALAKLRARLPESVFAELGDA